MSVPDFVERFYQELLNRFTSDELDADWQALCPQCTFDEWKEYCFSSESPY